MPDLYDPQSFNAYAYVNNLPTSRTDPGGHEPYLTGPNGGIVADLNGMTIYYEGMAIDPTQYGGAFDGLIGATIGDQAWIFPEAPITTSDYQAPLTIPYNSGDPSLGIPAQEQQVWYPSQMSAADLKQLNRQTTGVNMVTTLGGAFLGGVTGGLGATGAGFELPQLTSIGPVNSVDASVSPYQIQVSVSGEPEGKRVAALHKNDFGIVPENPAVQTNINSMYTSARAYWEGIIRFASMCLNPIDSYSRIAGVSIWLVSR